MSFALPQVLYTLFLLPLLVFVFIVSERGRKAQVAMISGSGKPGMIMGAGFERRLLFLVFLVLGIGMLVLAAARPQWGTKLETVTSRGIDVMIAVDVSDSMRATDVSPTRIAKARQQVDKFLELLSGDRVGLIAFAGSAYTYCPLTVDYAAIRLFLEGLTPGVIADGGTDVGAAIREAVETFGRGESTAHKVLVIFSDGEHHEDNPIPAVNEAVDAGIQVFTIGIGNAGKVGERIPLGEENGETIYKLDLQGNLVITQLDEETLRAIAGKGGGEYYRVSEAGTELIEIYRSVAETQEAEFSSRIYHQREDRYQIPLLIGAILLVIAYSLGDRSFKKLRRTQGAVT
jgi:Ca-activated chloride channel family protein